MQSQKTGYNSESGPGFWPLGVYPYHHTDTTTPLILATGVCNMPIESLLGPGPERKSASARHFHLSFSVNDYTQAWKYYAHENGGPQACKTPKR